MEPRGPPAPAQWRPRIQKMERETGFEPATSTLARSHSTTELFPLVRNAHHTIGPTRQSTRGSSIGCVERAPIHRDLRVQADRVINRHDVEAARARVDPVERQIL